MLHHRFEQVCYSLLWQSIVKLSLIQRGVYHAPSSSLSSPSGRACVPSSPSLSPSFSLSNSLRSWHITTFSRLFLQWRKKVSESLKELSLVHLSGGSGGGLRNSSLWRNRRWLPLWPLLTWLYFKYLISVKSCRGCSASYIYTRNTYNWIPLHSQ